MSKALERSIQFSNNPPAPVIFTPVRHKMIRAALKLRLWHDTELLADQVADDQGELSGQWFDPMERGDPVFICFKRTMHMQGKPSRDYEDWCPAVCISAGRERVFESLQTPGLKWKQLTYNQRGLEIWRIPYRWRPAVLKLKATYESREAAERAMTEVTS